MIQSDPTERPQTDNEPHGIRMVPKEAWISKQKHPKNLDNWNVSASKARIHNMNLFLDEMSAYVQLYFLDSGLY